MDSGQRIGIVGAGAWGLSAAHALADSGFTNLTVFERGELGAGATSLAAGLVSTHLRQESDIRLVLETEKRLSRLREWGREQGRPSAEHVFHETGGLTVTPLAQAHKLEALHERIRRAGGDSQRLDSEALGNRWPLQSTKHLTGIFTPHDGHVEAGDLVDLLQANLKDHGVAFRTGGPGSLVIEDGECVGVQAGGVRERLDGVLLAAGAWSKTVAHDAGFELPLKAYRTQLAQLEFAHAPDFPIFHDTEQTVYARPDGANRILVGDGTEFVESHPETYERGPDRPFIEKVARAMSRRWKGGAEARFRKGWAGLCVATPDRHPLVGPHPVVKRLHLMVGDNGFGVMRSLALGAIAAARVGGKMLPGAELYAPKRFGTAVDFQIREGFEL